ncbi:alpha/beta hydrolase [Streptomyces sp. DSM 44917]|uniref:Alpha/beta hydrolase n=1 Tax=Streptomyces boetiae TaxID=3075541 RepID=A0ABU2L7U0_9ACTN|nr:alpha/beta hydrolase [Streptomyces sp. DSM 44917]MDT0307363.1 alpha/beta hydrolase [Streptomyces sp. DSM 44917]
MPSPARRRSARSLVLASVAALLALTPAYWALAAGSDPATAGAGSPAGTRVEVDAEAAAEDTRARLAAADIVDLPVSFTVVNQNRTLAACAVDGETYTIRGHLTAPADVLEAAADGEERAITLYEHGIAAGEWYWRLDAEGYHHAEELARRGHASLTIDRLGYDSSDQPNGNGSCIGGQADMAQQIVDQLREGSYEIEGGETYAFDRVFLAGQSNGGQVVQIAAYSFQDVDGLVIMDWTDLGLTPQANARFFTSLQTCLRGGEDGYAYYDLGSEEFATGNFNDTDPTVLELAVPHQNRHPCGDMVSQLGGVLMDTQRIQDIDVPVLFLYGEEDARVTGGEEHRALFTGTDDTEILEVPDAGHYMGLERQAPLVHETLADWLDRHGG